MLSSDGLPLGAFVMNQGKPIPIEDPVRDTPGATKLMLARAQAIQVYASLEQSLAHLFANLLRTDAEAAGTVFFRIVNTRSRLVILKKLLRQRHASAYNVFWSSIDKALRSDIDQKRNEIVHWHVVKELNIGDDVPTSTYKLAPPNFWTANNRSPKITVEDLMAFTAKCDFISRLMSMFHMHLLGKLPDPAWPEIFRQPVAYPPPDSHPLSGKTNTPQTPIEPFQK